MRLGTVPACRGRFILGLTAGLLVAMGMWQVAAAGAATLWDQSSPESPERLRVGYNPNSPSYDMEGADDFVVPAGARWDVNSAMVQGVWDGSARPSSVDVTIYNDSNGKPGAVFGHRAGLGFSSDAGGTISTNFSAISLPAGRYWFSLQPNTTGPYVWTWSLFANQNGWGGQYRNPDGRWSGCTTWFDVQSCFTGTTAQDYAFRLSGTVGHQLTYTTTGPGTGSINVDPPGGPTGSPNSQLYAAGTVVNLTAQTQSGPESYFGGWTGCDSVSGRVCTVTVNSSRSVQANFLQASGLTINKEGAGLGAVTSSPAGVDCPAGECETPSRYHKFPRGSTVQLTAQPNSASVLNRFVGCDSVSGRVCTITLSGDGSGRTVQIFFEPAQSMDFKKQGAGDGAVTSSPAGLECGLGQCRNVAVRNRWQVGTTLVLTATPNATSVFSGWTGCESAAGAQCTMVLDSPGETPRVEAIFDPDADGDGIADANDACPAAAAPSTPDGCPTNGPPTNPDPNPVDPGGPPGADDAACQKAKKKLAKAKAKVRKLKKQDAAPKKVDKAKKRVTRFKKAVKAACAPA